MRDGEVIELAKVASRHGGIYSSHMRNEARGLLASVRELIRIADEADLPAQIQHHKAFGPGQWGWSERSLALVDSAREAGLDVKHDQYPYTAASTGSDVLFPEWALAGGDDSLAARLEDPELTHREPLLSQGGAEARVDGVVGADELDVGVQRPALVRRSPVFRAHGRSPVAIGVSRPA